MSAEPPAHKDPAEYTYNERRADLAALFADFDGELDDGDVLRLAVRYNISKWQVYADIRALQS